jgi:hypothetical protein
VTYDEFGRPHTTADRPVASGIGTLFPHASAIASAISATGTSVTFATPVALFCSASGAIRITTAGGETLTVPACPANVVLPFQATTIYNSATSATGIIALW